MRLQGNSLLPKWFVLFIFLWSLTIGEILPVCVENFTCFPTAVDPWGKEPLTADPIRFFLALAVYAAFAVSLWFLYRKIRLLLILPIALFLGVLKELFVFRPSAASWPSDQTTLVISLILPGFLLFVLPFLLYNLAHRILQNRHKTRKGFVAFLSLGYILFFGMQILPELPEKTEDQTSPLGAKIENCQRKFTPTLSNARSYYEGELFDSHFHLPVAPGIMTPFIKQAVLGVGKDVTLNEILCLFDKEKTKGAISFYMPKKLNKTTLPQAAEISRYAKDRLSLFISPTALSAAELDQVLTENPNLFVGIGEAIFYEGVSALKPIDGPWAMRIYQIAFEHQIPVMIHPGDNQQAQLEKVLAQNPKTIFILHGHETERDIDRLMGKYPNIYYSVDSATLYALSGKFVMDEKGFLSEFKREFRSILDEKVSYWKDKIERYPDRYMWGTDRGATWHYTEEISTLFEEFARSFIARLDPSVQEKYAYQNAEKLLKLR